MATPYIIGSGMIRFGKHKDATVRSMAEEAITLALKDADLSKGDIQAAFFSNTFWGMFGNQYSIRGQVVLRGMGIDKIPVVNIENACAGASSALHLAYTGIRAGIYDVALVIGSEKITGNDKATTFAAYGTAMDVENFQSHVANILAIGKSFKNVVIPKDETAPGENRSIFMDAYAMGDAGIWTDMGRLRTNWR